MKRSRLDWDGGLKSRKEEASAQLKPSDHRDKASQGAIANGSSVVMRSAAPIASSGSSLEREREREMVGSYSDGLDNALVGVAQGQGQHSKHKAGGQRFLGSARGRWRRGRNKEEKGVEEISGPRRKVIDET